MTSPIQIPTLRPTDVVREPGLDQPQGELPALARLLMAKGQLALEQEKFQNEMAQQKQKKQTLDQLHQGLSQVFSQMPQTPEGTMSAMQQAIPMVGGAGEPVGPLVSQLPNLQQQVTGAATKKALGSVLNEYAAQNVRDPGVQAEMLMHIAQIDPEAAFRVSEGLKNLRDPNDPLHVNMGNDGALYATWMDKGMLKSKKVQDTGAKTAPNQQTARIAAAQTVQDITDMEALLAKDPSAGKVPLAAAGLEGAQAAGGVGGAVAGFLEPFAKGQYTANQLMFRRLKLNFVDHYAAAVIGRRAAGSPATMKLVLDGFFGAAGEDQPAVQAQAAEVRARTKKLMMDWANGKPVDLSALPGFANLMTDANGVAPGGGGAAPGAAPTTPLTPQDLLQGPPK